ncbi:Eukaryotic translation initiation factor 2d [Thalictrum thalictroides]|uniref:Eukaryotic translation initiation factor 2d n=1 Tax=Thalictrum thalictroides TaxID=46969 RepID=A0A7J6WGX8_THATH|nr:Eukaryotic translation initiation factor 2d [Thalictrum thalictroides]
MFKQTFKPKSHSERRLSGADRNKLRRTLKERFLNASDADLDLIFPPKTDIYVSKYPNRVLVYTVDGGFPMFFDIHGRGTHIFPTVYALWQVPELLPAFMLKVGEVSRFVIGGEDLMFSGISIPEGLPSFQVGQPWAVKVPGNATPIAVGTTTMSSSEALKARLHGKALRITHYYWDSLWDLVEGHLVRNGGIFEDVVLEDPALSLGCLTSDSCEDSCSTTSSHQNGLTGEVADVGAVHQEQYLDCAPYIDIKKDIPEDLISDTCGLKLIPDASVEAESVENDIHEISSTEVDALLDKCLLQALHTSLNDKDLPMHGSILWSNHVLPCRPSGIILNIKKSSHKKLSKWLQSKSSARLISAKEDKHKKEVILLAVNRMHSDYISFRPEVVDHRIDTNAIEGCPPKLHLELLEIYKPSVHVNPIFKSAGLDTGSFYSASEATEIAFQYVENQNLFKPTDKAIVVLDATLCDALFNGTIVKESTYPPEIHKEDLAAAFLSQMQAYHRVTRGDETVVRKGAVKTVQIMMECRLVNKRMTRVWGLESFFIDVEALAEELQKKFGCRTTVAELPVKKRQEVLVQRGRGVIKDLERHLVENYGIPKRYIEVFDRTRRADFLARREMEQVDCVISDSSDLSEEETEHDKKGLKVVDWPFQVCVEG